MIVDDRSHFLDEKFYRVEVGGNGRATVVDAKQQAIIQCMDRNNAEHYCVLLNKAYETGYKQGVKSVK
ncbi:MAG: hypothetical protein OEZ68_12885 [Gammaproteobacteria bacterium]|nr:hypothetical protein [Gammaproteobacteria bacterium]MDH5801693.1 hypothetical protein [Gammaproteobacteria bacterium]